VSTRLLAHERKRASFAADSVTAGGFPNRLDAVLRPVMRDAVTGWLRRNSGTSTLLLERVARPMRAKNPAIASGSKPALAKVKMPMRSASYSLWRVKLIACCCIRPMPLITAASAPLPVELREAMIAPSIASAIGRVAFCIDS
jgi:hypothetical protein